jgi:hypothetical protein
VQRGTISIYVPFSRLHRLFRATYPEFHYGSFVTYVSPYLEKVQYRARHLFLTALEEPSFVFRAYVLDAARERHTEPFPGEKERLDIRRAIFDIFPKRFLDGRVCSELPKLVSGCRYGIPRDRETRERLRVRAQLREHTRECTQTRRAGAIVISQFETFPGLN